MPKCPALFLSDELLIRLFERHFSDSVAALRRLDAHLASVELPFDLKAQLRELIHPLQPGQPKGIPSFIYYFVPNSRRGSEEPNPPDPLNPAFINTTDGIGLNLGCPVRLLRALDALAQLNPEDQKEPRDALRNPTQHLSAVEELLWLTVWKSPSHLRRGDRFLGMPGNVDWALQASTYPIFLESKFRQSDWPRLSEGGSFLRVGDGFLSNAAHKFPDPPQAAALHVVGITTFDNINKEIVQLVGLELELTPQIHAVVFRSLAQMTHVLSLSVQIRDRVLGLLTVPSIQDFPLNYGVFFHREQQAQRIAKRPLNQLNSKRSNVVCLPLEPTGVLPFPMPEPGLYRLSITSRGSDGEPHFQIIPKYLMRPEEKKCIAMN